MLRDTHFRQQHGTIMEIMNRSTEIQSEAMQILWSGVCRFASHTLHELSLKQQTDSLCLVWSLWHNLQILILSDISLKILYFV